MLVRKLFGIATAIICSLVLAGWALPQSASFQGLFQGNFDGGEGEVRISGAGPNHQVEISIGSALTGCAGEVRGVATARGNRMELEVPIDPQTLCSISFERTQSGLRVTENGCPVHGAMCAFVGTLSPVQSRGSGQQLNPFLDGGVAGVEASPPSGRAWWRSEDSENAFVVDRSSRVGLRATCYGDVVTIHVGVPKDGNVQTDQPINNQSSPLSQLFRGVTTMAVVALDQDARETAMVFVHAWQADTWVGWSEELEPAELLALKQASTLEVRSNRWAYAVPAAGSMAALDGLMCGMDDHGEI